MKYVKQSDSITRINESFVNYVVEIAKDQETFRNYVQFASNIFGYNLGYVAEFRFMEYIKTVKGVTEVWKPSDHDKSVNKSDVSIKYNGKTVRFQIKCPLKSTVKENPSEGSIHFSLKNHTSDKHTVVLQDGRVLNNTTLYRCDDYDVLVTPFYNGSKVENFAYLLGSDIPQHENNDLLMNTTVDFKYPLEGKWTTDIDDILKRFDEGECERILEMRLERHNVNTMDIDSL